MELPDGTMLFCICGARILLVKYDPHTGSFEKIFLRYSKAEFNGFIYLQGMFDKTHLLISRKSGLDLFDINTHELKPYIDGLPHQVLGIVKSGQDLYGVEYGSGKIIRIRYKKSECVKDDIPGGNLLCELYHLGGSEFCGLGDDGLFVRFDLRTGGHRTLQVRNSSRKGMSIISLCKVPGKEMLVGSHFINERIFKIDLRTGKSTSSTNKINAYQGQVNAATCLDAVVYLGSYTKAVLLAYYPLKRFKYGANPRVISEIGACQNRFVALTNDATNVYMVTKADYGVLGGAVSVYSPSSGKMQIFRDFVPRQNPSAAYYHTASKCIVGTTESFAEMRTSRSQPANAVVFLWDTESRSTIHVSSPWETDALLARGLSPGGKLIGFGEGKYFVFDVATRKYTVRTWPHTWVSGGVFLGERYFYAALAENIFRLDIKTGAVKFLGDAFQTLVFEKISEREIAFTYKGNIINKLVIH